MFCGMLMIRFQRVGRRNDAAFRLVVTEHTTGPKSNKHVELLGSYNPKTKALSLKKDRIEHWIGMGAQVSDSVHNLLVSQGVIEGSKKNVLPKKAPIVSDTPVEEEKAPAAEEAAPAESEAPAEEAPAEEAPAPEAAPEEAPAPEETPAEEEKKEEAAA